MVDFQEVLKQASQNLTQSRNSFSEVKRPSDDLKHKELYFPKTEGNVLGQVMVRILPSIDPNDPMGFFKMYREVQLNARNSANTKDIFGKFILPEVANPNSILEHNLEQWKQKGIVTDRFGGSARIRQCAKVNIIQVANSNGNMVYELDEQGQLMIRTLSLPISAIRAIIEKLQDPMLSPNPNDPMSFISSQTALPICIKKPAPNSMAYSVDVYSNFPLAPLPQGWETLAEDLVYQTTPSEEYGKEYNEYIQLFIDYFNGTTNSVQPQAQGQTVPQGQFGNQGVNTWNTQGVAPTQVTQPTYNSVPNQQFSSAPPTQFTPQMGASNQFPPTQEPQVTPPAFGAQTSVTPPVQQVQSTAPIMQQQMGITSMSPPMDNLPDLGAMANNPVVQPPVQQQQQQELPPEPPVQVDNSGMPNIDDLLNQMQGNV